VIFIGEREIISYYVGYVRAILDLVYKAEIEPEIAEDFIKEIIEDIFVEGHRIGYNKCSENKKRKK
jgi:hypothetical protein